MRLDNIEKTYDPSKVEEKIYHRWMEKDYFHTEVDREKEPFCIVIPHRILQVNSIWGTP